VAPFEAEADQDAGPQVEAQIARIIAQNRGSGIRS
jgi:hypothetical protein